MDTLLLSLPWYITRASALTGFALMFLIVVLGTGMTTGFIYGLINPTRSWTIHKYLSLSLTVMILLHASSLLFDNFIRLRLADILVPFNASYQPLFVGLGTIGFYILVAIIFISIFLRVKMPRFWRSTHYWVYPLFALSLIHGFFVGTDSSSLIMQMTYWFTGLVFIGLLIYRFIIYKAQIKFKKIANFKN